jgi:4-amino-4-deoxy-L-arabinose transferase-like glycosyltransferase
VTWPEAFGVNEASRWRTAFWVLWALLLAVKIVLAATLAPFGDEAWYWQESRALDWSYSDLPLATAVLIRAGEACCGHGVLAMRVPFLLLGSLIAPALAQLGRRLFGERVGWQAGILALALPLLATMGLFALPDAPLTLCAVLALDFLERAARTRRWRDWTLLGLALAGAWLSHYRAAMLLLTGLAFLLLSARGRALWRDRGLWIAVALSLAGLVPILLFNAQHGWVALGFQLVERNPWSFHADGLVQPVEQAIVCTPLFYAAMLWALWHCLRRVGQGGPWDLLAICAATTLVAWFVLGCFADDARLRLHWPVPGYLPLLVALPALLAERSGDRHRWMQRAVQLATFALLAAGCLVTLAYFTMAAIPGGASALARFKAFPEHWVGWNEVAAHTQSLLAEPRFRDATLVADNFMLAAELDFALGASRPVYTLDHPINAKHGRVPQLALWRRDESALRELGPRPLLLVVEPTARRERERAAWLESVCGRLDDPKLTEIFELYSGRKRYLFVSAQGVIDAPAARAERAAPDCLAAAVK